MKNYVPFIIVFIGLLAVSQTFSQSGKQLSAQDTATVTELFNKANGLLEKKDYADALATYEAALKILPDDPAILYNGGFAAFLNGDDTTAVVLWRRLKQIEPDDWQGRAKLIQAYQRLGKTVDRDKEREELFALRKKGSNKDLGEQIEYCRDRFQAGGRSVLAFELFEFKGPRGIRYVFSVLDDQGREDHRISLGSYDVTNSIWQQTTRPKPKKGERLFHLDGYFRNGGHATYGMFRGEPTYEETKTRVVDILEKKKTADSATIPAEGPKPEQK